MVRCQRRQLGAPAVKERINAYDERTRSGTREQIKRRVDFARSARAQNDRLQPDGPGRCLHHGNIGLDIRIRLDSRA